MLLNAVKLVKNWFFKKKVTKISYKPIFQILEASRHPFQLTKQPKILRMSFLGHKGKKFAMSAKKNPKCKYKGHSNGQPSPHLQPPKVYHFQYVIIAFRVATKKNFNIKFIIGQNCCTRREKIWSSAHTSSFLYFLLLLNKSLS